MRRLTLVRLLGRALPTPRERGATTVLVALLMLVLVGFAALAVDVGNMWSVRKQLQNGADAAALAVAASCAKDLNSADCVQAMAAADSFAKRNKLGAPASGTVVSITRSYPGSVTVRASSQEPSILAGALGRSASQVSAEATAAWRGSPSMLGTIPLIIGNCYLKQVTGGLPPNGELVTFKLLNSGNGGNSGNGAGLCPKDESNPPGGFGWLDTTGNAGGCDLTTSVGQVAPGQTGKPAKCGDVTALLGGQGSILELPLYDYSTGEGSSGSFHIIGYVALQLYTYCIDQQQLYSDGVFGHCGQGQQYLQGTVVAYPSSAGGSGQGPNFGITFVGLTD